MNFYSFSCVFEAVQILGMTMIGSYSFQFRALSKQNNCIPPCIFLNLALLETQSDGATKRPGLPDPGTPSFDMDLGLLSFK